MAGELSDMMSPRKTEGGALTEIRKFCHHGASAHAAAYSA